MSGKHDYDFEATARERALGMKPTREEDEVLRAARRARRSDFSGPIVDVLEEVVVQSPVVGEIQRSVRQLLLGP